MNSNIKFSLRGGKNEECKNRKLRNSSNSDHGRWSCRRIQYEWQPDKLKTVHVGNAGNDGEWSGESYSGTGPDRICGAVSMNTKLANTR